MMTFETRTTDEPACERPECRQLAERCAFLEMRCRSLERALRAGIQGLTSALEDVEDPP